MCGYRAPVIDCRFGMKMSITLHTQSHAAKGIMSRRGLGKVRHIDVAYLWLQQNVEEVLISVRKVHGKNNPADLCAKYLGSEEIMKHLFKVKFEHSDGRRDAIPNIT
jgi:hypothetical protein